MPANVVYEIPPVRDDYQFDQVDAEYFADKLRPKQFLHIDQSECVLCEGCVDICPWKCLFLLSLDAIAEAVNVDHPAADTENQVFFLVDEDECTRCGLCVDRCLTNVITLGRIEGSLSVQAASYGFADALAKLNRRPWDLDSGQRDHRNGYAYGLRNL